MDGIDLEPDFKHVLLGDFNLVHSKRQVKNACDDCLNAQKLQCQNNLESTCQSLPKIA